MSETILLGDWLGSHDFGLTMSSGFFGFYAHAGVVHALEEAKLRPVRVSGSSAGALVTASWATGLSSEDIKQQLFDIGRDDFWDPSLGLGFLRGERFRQKLASMLPVQTFEECKTPAAVSVYDVLAANTRVRQRGDLVPAIYASCCVPFMFQPAWLNGRPYLDGGILDRPGLLGMQEGLPVLYHHLNSRSAWRRKNGAQTIIPQRKGMISLTISSLPRVGPSALENGPLAWQQAYDATRMALEMPIDKQSNSVKV